MPTPSKPSHPIPPTLSLYASHTTTHIAHLHRLLSRTSTLDTTLLTTTYTLHLLHSLLTRTPLTARLPLTTTLPPLTALLDDYRILLRLSGLLGIYTWAASTYLHPPKNAVVRYITWMQVGACAVYQGLENGAFLAGRGVVGWERERVGRAWVWSGRAWMAYVGLEFLRLGVQWREFLREDGGGRGRVEGVLRERAGAGKEGGGGKKERGGGELESREENETEVERMRVELRREEEVAGERWNKWKRELGVNAAYAPMTVHYSLRNGPLGEGSLGALGVVVGWLTFGKAWRESA